MASPDSSFDFDTLQTEYIAALQKKDELYQQIKPINKEIRGMEKRIKEHMRNNNLETLIVGPNEFTTQTSKRLKITEEDLLELLPEGTDIESYMQENSSISKKRKREGEAQSS